MKKLLQDLLAVICARSPLLMCSPATMMKGDLDDYMNKENIGHSFGSENFKQPGSVFVISRISL